MGKKLGQHFLRDHNILRKIVERANVNRNDTIIEIGAGNGSLTTYLVRKAGKVIAYEIDDKLYRRLKEKFIFCDNLILRKEDFLKIDPAMEFSVLPAPRKVVANIPYYLTTPLIFKLITSYEYIDDIYLTLQKEYAERLIAKPGTKEYGAVTITVSIFSEPEILFYISRNSFRPPPKVNSAYVHLKKRKKLLIDKELFPKFSKFILRIFSQRRKMLKNTIKSIPNYDESKIPPELIKKRPEELDIKEFIELFKNLYTAE